MEVFHGNGCFRKLEGEVDIIEGMEKKKEERDIETKEIVVINNKERIMRDRAR